MTSLKTACLALPFLLSAGIAQAQDDFAQPQDSAMRNTFYIGAGKNRDEGEFDTDNTPFSLGFMHQLADRKLILGFDIGREGTMLDSTWGMDKSPRQATSYNFLIGGNMADTGRFKADAALLLGMRESVADCADSYLGYQCYADQEPDTDYKGNFGAVVTFSFDRVVMGVRATGESTQIVAGLRF